eukprot:Sspe_Gene.114720::Locus_100907_Transcript_1_1_Confidence_1.000_Length_714::g.114720::m.114720
MARRDGLGDLSAILSQQQAVLQSLGRTAEAPVAPRALATPGSPPHPLQHPSAPTWKGQAPLTVSSMPMQTSCHAPLPPPQTATRMDHDTVLMKLGELTATVQHLQQAQAEDVDRQKLLETLIHTLQSEQVTRPQVIQAVESHLQQISKASAEVAAIARDFHSEHLAWNT